MDPAMDGRQRRREAHARAAADHSRAPPRHSKRQPPRARTRMPRAAAGEQADRTRPQVADRAHGPGAAARSAAVAQAEQPPRVHREHSPSHLWRQGPPPPPARPAAAAERTERKGRACRRRSLSSPESPKQSDRLYVDTSTSTTASTKHAEIQVRLPVLLHFQLGKMACEGAEEAHTIS